MEDESYSYDLRIINIQLERIYLEKKTLKFFKKTKHKNKIVLIVSESQETQS